MLTVGLTGDVGAGKTTLSRIWQTMGATVFNADDIARDMWKLPEIQKKAEARWGAGFFEGDWRIVLDRIAEKIFRDEEEYRFASSLIHASTMNELKRRVEQSKGWVVVEIPLLYECGLPDWIDEVVFVSATPEKRVERNKIRGWDENEIRRRDSKLLSRSEKINRADWVIENTGSVEDLETKARELALIFIRGAGSTKA